MVLKKREIEAPNEEVVEEKVVEEYKPSSPVMAEAQRINDEKKTLLDREEALQERKEKFAAEELASGRAVAGQEQTEPKEETPREYRDRIDKEIAEGKHDD